MRRLTAFIQNQQLFLRIFINLQGPFCVNECVFVFMDMHLFLQAWSACSVYSLCLCVGGEPAEWVPSKSASTAWSLLSLVGMELKYCWLACLHWQREAKRHRPAIMFSALSSKLFIRKWTADTKNVQVHGGKRQWEFNKNTRDQVVTIPKAKEAN